MPPSLDPKLDRQAQHRLAVLRHAEDVTGNVAMTCRYYGISRQTFYKWLRRYQDEGIAGLRGPESLIFDRLDVVPMTVVDGVVA